MSWIIKESTFNLEKIELNGSKFLLANGYMGYRGTMEEFSKNELVSCTLSGVYDKVGSLMREPVNAPNALMTRLYCNGIAVDVRNMKVLEHTQCLDIKRAVHTRYSKFNMNGINVEIRSERFLSADRLHLLVMKYAVKCSKDCAIEIETGIDCDVWDISGPHLKDMEPEDRQGIIVVKQITNELNYTVAIAEAISLDFGDYIINKSSNFIMRKIRLNASADMEYSFIKYSAIFTSLDDVEDPVAAAVDESRTALNAEYDTLSAAHKEVWETKWKDADVIIEGDENAQLALRYSIYHLLAIAPGHTDKASIPARGLSGQVYKGGVFWDTEMFMLPLFICNNPTIARNLLKYRCNTIEGARRKACKYGYRGAFYAWESQETGDDACSHFNLTDVFTNRPIRTYFRDRQIHVSADVVYGLWKYYEFTGDEGILLDGGAEVILECARFYFSYSHFKREKNRYEILQVVGPDEYHERVDNNAFTNRMVKFTLEFALEVLELLKDKYPVKYSDLIYKLDYIQDIEKIIEMNELLYIPQPSPENSIIEQFDGYFRMEDISLKDLKERIIMPNEYLGGTSGLATTTQIIKQADVIMMLKVFKDEYSEEEKKANWEYYEPRTEHGSSLSHCAYAIVAADIGKTDWAYEYFMKTATLDLIGNAKQYAGTLYIGGTHPAANGGAWMTAVLGFAGVGTNEGLLHINPQIPSGWKSLAFRLIWKGIRLFIKISNTEVKLDREKDDLQSCTVKIWSRNVEIEPGKEIIVAK